jgi:2-phospho-L-lactate guanylyltransferase
VTIWAVVPAKAPDKAKFRLSNVLTGEQRERLMRTMLGDVLKYLSQVPGISGVALVAPDPGIAPPGVRWIRDPGGGLNTALAHAASVLHSEGVTAILIISADTPLTTPREIDSIVAAGRESRIVLVPDRKESGTNALLLSPPNLMLPQFGEQSFTRHIERAEDLGIIPAVLRLPGLGLDIDDPEDLEALRKRVIHRNAYGFLRPCAGVGQ